MKINQKVIYLSMVFTFLVAMASNVAIVDALEAGKLTKVAPNVGYFSTPVWSPSGNEILFARDSGLYKVFSDGSGEKKLSNGNGGSWSPDGSKIKYYQDAAREDGYIGTALWIMNADGTKKIKLLGPMGDLFYLYDTWFPSGSKIAYVISFDDIGGAFWEINPDGSNNHEIGGSANGVFAISPDASKIACNFWDWDPDSPNEIYVYDLNQNKYYPSFIGSIYRQTQSWQPEVWSPDSSKIVYGSYENEHSDIYTIKADGTGKTQLTSDSVQNSFPIFSPDGSKILYVSDKTGNDDIWVMDSDGKNKVQLTTDPAKDSYPAWSPDGKKIAFYSERGGDHAIYTLTLVESGSKLPAADFSASKTSGTAPLTVKFTDKSTGSPNAWKWSFGDGSALLTAYNPTHTYTTAGIYTVKETVSNAVGKNTAIKTNYIKVTTPPKPPIAAFSASPLSGKKTLTVTFTDKSTNNPTSWSWNFGDKSTSTVKNPAHKYTKAGKYTVSLTVKNAAGSKLITKSGYITVK